MKQKLTKVGDTYWIKLSMVSGVMKTEKAYRLLIGDNGVQIPQDFTEFEMRVILAKLGMKGF